MSLSDTLHQGHAQRVLQRALSGDRVPHAYVFHGPDGVGKERLAMGFAGRLLCGEPATRCFNEKTAEQIGVAQLSEGCGKCVDCRTIAAGNHADIHLVHRYLNREHPEPKVRQRKGVTLSIDVIRHFLIEPVRLTAQRGRGKVFVVREANRMTPQAQNALLKTLEEPPPGSFIILLARSTDAMLETTRSRCQPVRFDALPRAFVTEKLQQGRPELSADLAGWYAGIAQGCIGPTIHTTIRCCRRLKSYLGRWRVCRAVCGLGDRRVRPGHRNRQTHGLAQVCRRSQAMDC